MGVSFPARDTTSYALAGVDQPLRALWIIQASAGPKKAHRQHDQRHDLNFVRNMVSTHPHESGDGEDEDFVEFSVAGLVKGVMPTMFLTKLKIVSLVVLAVGLLGAGMA